MLSLTSEYALRAMIYLAQHADECPIPGRRIAQAAQIPAKYLSNILAMLVRQGCLSSSPGKLGGFRLRRPPQELMLDEVLTPFERFDDRRCPFGNRLCDDNDPCLAHRKWKKVIETERKFLRETSLYDVAINKRKRPTVSKGGGASRRGKR